MKDGRICPIISYGVIMFFLLDDVNLIDYSLVVYIYRIWVLWSNIIEDNFIFVIAHLQLLPSVFG